MVHIFPAASRLCARSSFELASGRKEGSIVQYNKALALLSLQHGLLFNKCDDKSFDSANPIPTIRSSGRKDSDYI